MKPLTLHLVMALVLALGLTPVRPVQAAGTVGSGTAVSCTEAALDAALAGGGTITFNCGGPATIILTTQKLILADTFIDGGGLVTLSGNNATRLFFVGGGYTLVARNITLTRGLSPVGGALVESAGAYLHFDHVGATSRNGNNRTPSVMVTRARRAPCRLRCDPRVFDPTGCATECHVGPRQSPSTLA